MKFEPALITGLVVAVLNALIAFQVIDDTTKQAVVAIVGALLPLVGAFFLRSVVTPVAKAKA